MNHQPSISRRIAVSRIAGVALAGLAVAGSRPVLGFDYTSVSIPDELRVETEVEIEGELRVGENEAKPIRLPLEAKAKIAYFLKKLPQLDTETSRSVRDYESATATIKLRGKPNESKLADDRRIILSRGVASGWLTSCPLGPLSREEVELIQTGGNVDAIRQLLPEKEVASKERWTATNESLISLLGLNEIAENSVKLQGVVDNEKSVVTVDGEGKLKGTVGGVETEIELKLKISLDAESSSLRWFTAAIRETRAIGNAQPGCETVTKIKTVFRAANAPPTLADNALAQLTLDNEANEQMLRITPSRAQYSVLADARWFLVLDRPELTVMRMVDRNQILGQCNVASLPPANADKPVTLESYAAEVQRSLGQSFKELLETDSFQTSGGLDVIKVKVSGASNDIVVHWTYYHVVDAEGRRASLAFTCNAEKVQHFAETDRTIVESFTFGEPGAEGPNQARSNGTTKR